MSSSSQLATVFVENDPEFHELCERWQQSESLALDTEFLRTNTFYSKIGLLQIADRNHCYLIDPLKIGDWGPFKELLSNSACQFVIHSCSEDLNLLYTFLGVLPSKLFDTQLAAAFLGLGYSPSYQALVNLLMGIEVAKDETRSDWLKRPLSEKQLTYAANDVRYLLDIQEQLTEQLQLKNMMEWFENDCTEKISTAIEAENQDNWQYLYGGISNAWRMSDRTLLHLQRLCYWRETEARERNKPRSWIAKDQDLSGIAQHLGESDSVDIADLQSAPSVDRHLVERKGPSIVRLLQDAELQLAPINRSLLNKPLAAESRKKLKALQKSVMTTAEKHELAPELLGRKKLLQQLLRGFEAEGALRWEGPSSRWRQALLEPDFLSILSS